MKFAEMKMLTVSRLLEVEIGEMFISSEAMEQVRKILALDGKTASELTAIRNAVVRFFYDEFINPILEQHEDYAEYNKYQSKVSGIVSVIDSKLFEMGALY